MTQERLVEFLLSTVAIGENNPALAYLACENAKHVRGLRFPLGKRLVDIQMTLRYETGKSRDTLLREAMQSHD